MQAEKLGLNFPCQAFLRPSLPPCLAASQPPCLPTFFPGLPPFFPHVVMTIDIVGKDPPSAPLE